MRWMSKDMRVYMKVLGGGIETVIDALRIIPFWRRPEGRIGLSPRFPPPPPPFTRRPHHQEHNFATFSATASSTFRNRNPCTRYTGEGEEFPTGVSVVRCVVIETTPRFPF